MNRENTEKLLADFPWLYRGHTLGPQHNLMCFGFCCDDGWFDLVYRLSAQLTEYAQAHGIQEQLTAQQVKEKFGGLRFYIAPVPAPADAIWAMIDAAEAESERTCERCSAPGRLLCKPNGWYATLCPACAPEGSSLVEGEDADA